jgi:hypothetical protein
MGESDYIGGEFNLYVAKKRDGFGSEGEKEDRDYASLLLQGGVYASISRRSVLLLMRMYATQGRR